jgi:hypothetical protein
MLFSKLLGLFRGLSSAPAAVDLIAAKRCPSSTLAIAIVQKEPAPPISYCHADIPAVNPIRALLVDAAGTLVSPSEKAAHVYQRFGKPYGVQLSEPEILHRFRLCVCMGGCFSPECSDLKWHVMVFGLTKFMTTTSALKLGVSLQEPLRLCGGSVPPSSA